MPKFEVLVTRYYCETAEIEIEAENADEAMHEAAKIPIEELDFFPDGCFADPSYETT